MRSIVDYIKYHAEEHPSKVALVCGGRQMTYRELYHQVKVTSRQYADSEFNRRWTELLRAEMNINFLVSYFAIQMAGKVVVPLAKDLPESRFYMIEAELKGLPIPEGTADILYTTGTTGVAKGVMISHQAWIASAENLIEGQQYHDDMAFVITGPLNHIGSLSKIYPVIMKGGTLILVDGMRDIHRFWETFLYPSDHMATFLVPAHIRLLLQFSSGEITHFSHKIDFIETGATMISESDMKALCRLLPHARLYNTYATTETGVISTYDFNRGKCMQGCLGKPLGHSSISIDDDGSIICHGDTLMTGYVGDNERTKAVLQNGALHTPDIGMIDKNGMLHLMGREDDVINVGGYKVAPTEVEDAVMGFQGVADCICIPVEHELLGSALKMLVKTNDGQILNKHALSLYLSTRLEPYKIPRIYEQVREIKRTYNGKLDRKAYSL